MLPAPILIHLVAVVVPHGDIGFDEPYWGLSSNNMLFFHSFYSLFIDNVSLDVGRIWELAWK